jgi:hypothetical protein
MITYAQLCRKHQEYQGEYWKQIKALADGGYAIDKEMVSTMLPKLTGEEEDTYQLRLKNAYYLPYMGNLIGYYASSLGVDPIVVDTDDTSSMPAYYEEFQESVYRLGSATVDLNTNIQDQIYTAMLFTSSYCLVDFPALENDQPKTRLEEEMLGIDQAYLCPVDPLEVWNWCEDDEGQLEWISLHHMYTRQENIEDAEPYVYEDFTIYYEDRWVRYGYKYKAAKPPKEKEQPITTVEGSHPFGRVPVIRTTLPKQLCFGDKIYSVAKKIFQKQNALDYGSDKSLFQFIAIKLQEPDDTSIGGISEDQLRGVNQPVGPGRAWIGAEKDSISFVSPDASPFVWCQGHIEWLRTEMSRILNQTALGLTNSGAALKRSADSRTLDMACMEIILKHLGNVANDYAVTVMDMVAAGRKEQLRFTSTGGTDFEQFSIDEFVDRAMKIETINLPSPTFKADYGYELIKQEMTGHPEDRLELMYKELKAAYSSESTMADKMSTAQLGQLTDGDPTKLNE